MKRLCSGAWQKGGAAGTKETEGEKASGKRLMGEPVPWRVLSGSLQRGIGLLLASEGFLKVSSPQERKQCLAPQDITRQEQIDRRLLELWENGRCKPPLCTGRADGSAVYVRSV